MSFLVLAIVLVDALTLSFAEPDSESAHDDSALHVEDEVSDVPSVSNLRLLLEARELEESGQSPLTPTAKSNVYNCRCVPILLTNSNSRHLLRPRRWNARQAFQEMLACQVNQKNANQTRIVGHPCEQA